MKNQKRIQGITKKNLKYFSRIGLTVLYMNQNKFDEYVVAEIMNISADTVTRNLRKFKADPMKGYKNVRKSN